MGHCCILIPRPRDEKVCRGKRKSKEIPRRLHCWAWLYERVPSLGTTQKLIEFSWLYRWGECKLPNKVHDSEDRLKIITAEMVFEFNHTSQELCLLNLDSAIVVVVLAKDQEIKELKKRIAELEAAANKDLCVLTPAKADAAAIKEQCDRGAACEEQGDNDGVEKERKDEEEKDEKDEEMDEEKKDDEDEEEEEKAEQDDKKGEKEDGEDKEGKEKEGEKEEERKDGDDDEERDHNANNEHNDMNEENQTKHRAGQVSCHHEVEMNKKLEVISRKLNFGQDVDFGEWDYEAVRTLSSIIDDVQNQDELIEKCKSKDFDSPLKSDHGEEKKTIPEQEKAGSPKKIWSDLKLNVKAFEKYN
ncbi:hypothetical protein CDL12_27512 [Handroanthus impetiginosus]|uniref:Ubiquitinyl hydrolase 1 n=1 Tax=Handroanthus impetiginosus TaxID=429701 RepID=A0A2G9G3T7_9LAMI|nr:hypothetical protein CDL12_27512 [Handroanthus impetiginosus]